jgi:hypothetical protein
MNEAATVLREVVTGSLLRKRRMYDFGPGSDVAVELGITLNHLAATYFALKDYKAALPVVKEAVQRLMLAAKTRTEQRGEGEGEAAVPSLEEARKLQQLVEDKLLATTHAGHGQARPKR